MHSVAYRTNGVVTFAITILAALCVAATVTDLFNRPTPEADIQVLHYNWLQKSHGNDEASLTFNISADLRSLFTWNTKQVFIFIAAEYGTQKNQLNQVSLWDAIVPSKEHGKFWVHTTNKYVFVDQGTNLQSKEFNLTMHWHVMPRTGYMYAGKKVISGFQLPDSYR